MNPLRYVTLGIWLALLAALAFEHFEASHAHDALLAYQAGQEGYHKVRLQQLKDAHHEKTQENAGVAADRTAHPIGVVRLCRASGPVQAGGSAGPAAGSSAGPIQPVPAGDSGVRSEGAGPDIGPMQDALAASADSVSADLREQQAVH